MRQLEKDMAVSEIFVVLMYHCVVKVSMGYFIPSDGPGSGARGAACSAVARDRRGLSSSLHA